MTAVAASPRYGIGVRLFLAFGAVGAMTMAACVIAWVAFNSLSDSLSMVTESSLPAMQTATELADAGGAVIATAPALAAAETESERQRVWDHLTDLMEAMYALIGRMESDPPSPDQIKTLRHLVDEIRTNLVAVNERVAQHLGLSERNTALIESLRWSHAEFLDEVEPMIEEAAFNITLALERLRGGDVKPTGEDNIVLLRQEMRRREALMEVNAAGNLIVGLVARTAALTELETVSESAFFLGEAVDRLRENLDLTVLASIPDSLSLRQVSENLVSYAEGERSVPALRRQELRSLAEARSLLAVNRNLVQRLRQVISDQVRLVQATTSASASQSDRAIARGKVVLLITTAFSLLVAVVVAWLYVGRSLLARITALGRSMRAIAGGDLEAPVPLGGSDEISAMAEALLVFRDTAVEVENANAQSIIDNTVAGLLTTDERGVVLSFNPTAERLFGWPASAVVERQLVELFDERTRPDIVRFLAETPEDESETGGEAGLFITDVTVLRADGTKLAADVAIRAFRQRARRRFIVTIHDVSERAHAQEILEKRVKERTADLRRANRKLQAEIAERLHAEAVMRQTQDELVQAAKLAALGQMSAGIAHELNQPLSAIRSYAHNGVVLLERGRHADAQENLAKIQDLTERMAQISQHLKTFARKPASAVGPVHLKGTVLAALSFFDNRIRREQVEVENAIGDDLWVRAESIRLEQVLVNLVANALDAMRDVPQRRLRLDSRRHESRLSVSIADNGPGIDPEIVKRIFDPFFTTKPVGSGLGLGLSISYNIVKDFDGNIAVETRPGVGTTFTISLQTAEIPQ